MNAAQERVKRFGDLIAKGEKPPTAPELKVVPDVPPDFPKDPLPQEDQAMIKTPYPSPAETDAQIAKRLGLEKGKVVRCDQGDEPIRRKISSVDSNGMVTLTGSRKKIPARNFLPR